MQKRVASLNYKYSRNVSNHRLLKIWFQNLPKIILPWQGLATFERGPATPSVDFLYFKSLI